MGFQLKNTLILTLFSLLLLPSVGAARVADTAEDIQPIMVGAGLPEVTLTNINGEKVNLNELVKAKPTLLVFYRGSWCPYCNAHLADLRKIDDDLNKMGFQILAISPDQPKFLKEAIEKNKLDYTLLSDSDMSAAKALGLAFKVGDDTIKKYTEYGIDLEKNSGHSHHLLPVPAAILVNTKGEVTFTFVAPDYKVRVDNDLLLAAAKAQLSAKSDRAPN